MLLDNKDESEQTVENGRDLRQICDPLTESDDLTITAAYTMGHKNMTIAFVSWSILHFLYQVNGNKYSHIHLLNSWMMS